MIKPIKIITGMNPQDIKIWIDGEEITKDAFEVSIFCRVDGLPIVTIKRYVSKIEFEGMACEVKREVEIEEGKSIRKVKN